MSEAKSWLLDRRDRWAVAFWLLTRLLVVAISWLAALMVVEGDLQGSFLDRWAQWDVDLFVELAEYGYGGNPAEPHDPGLPAFFPGFPLVLRAVHLVVPNWSAAALLTSLVAGAVAMVALARIADLPAERRRPKSGRPAGADSHTHAHADAAADTDSAAKAGPAGVQRVQGARERAGGGRPGLWAVTALVLSPMAVFLFAGYSEALFLALALPAWLYARRGQWMAATVCCAVAGSVRITGLFLAVTLIVEFLVGPNGVRARRWRSALWLPVAFLGTAAYSLYLWRWTGDPQAWQHAQKAGWGREAVAPWEAFQTTWSAAFEVQNQFTVAFRGELFAALVGVLLLLWLLIKRSWAESVYVGLQLVALLTSSFYLSVGRATLLWWPLWIAIGGLAVRRPWIGVPLIALGTPFMAAQVISFTAGHWTG